MSRRIGIANAHGCQHIFNNFGVRQREGASTREREREHGWGVSRIEGGQWGSITLPVPSRVDTNNPKWMGEGGRVATLVLVVVFARAVYYRPYSAASTASVWEI